MESLISISTLDSDWSTGLRAYCTVGPAEKGCSSWCHRRRVVVTKASHIIVFALQMMGQPACKILIGNSLWIEVWYSNWRFWRLPRHQQYWRKHLLLPHHRWPTTRWHLSSVRMQIIFTKMGNTLCPFEVVQIIQRSTEAQKIQKLMYLIFWNSKKSY